MRRVAVLFVAVLGLLVLAPAGHASEVSADASKKKGAKGKKKPKKCRGSKVTLIVAGRKRCVPAKAALPPPKAGDPRKEVITEALTPEIAKIPDPEDKLPPPMEQVYRKLGPQALKGMEKSVGIALDRLDTLAAERAARPGTAARPGPASASAESANSFSKQFGNVTVDARLSIAVVGSELVGRVEFGTTTDRGDGTTVRVATEVPIRLTNQGFRSSVCPTLEGKVDAKDGIGITVRTEVRSNQGKTLEEFYLTEVVDETEMQGIVGDDAKLDTLEIRSIQDIKETAGGSVFGGSTVTGSVVRNTVVQMRNGNAYDPHVSLVNVGVKLSGILNALAPFLRPLVAERLKRAADKDFAATVDAEIKKFRELEEGWNTPNKCAKLAFGKANESLTLKKGDAGDETVRIEAKAGGTPAKADWTIGLQENGAFSLNSHGANPTSFHWEVLRGGENLKLKGTLRAASKVGVAEDTWVQKIDQDTINRITGTFSLRTEFFGSVFEWAGNAQFMRFVPAVNGPVDGGFELVNGLYTLTVSGKASQLVTDQCSMKGSGQFALHKGSSFTVFSALLDGLPPYQYSFGVGSEGIADLPEIEIEIYGCSKSAAELEGDRFSYPATLGFSTATPQTSQDGIDYSGSVTREEGNAKVIEIWDFEGKP